MTRLLWKQNGVTQTKTTQYHTWFHWSIDLLVEPTPITFLFLTGRASDYDFLEPIIKLATTKTKGNWAIAFDSHLKTVLKSIYQHFEADKGKKSQLQLRMSFRIKHK